MYPRPISVLTSPVSSARWGPVTLSLGRTAQFCAGIRCAHSPLCCSPGRQLLGQSCTPFCSVLLPLDVFASPQDCGLELNDEDGHRCYPLEDHLFCHSCHVKRLEQSPSSTALHQHRF